MNSKTLALFLCVTVLFSAFSSERAWTSNIPPLEDSKAYNDFLNKRYGFPTHKIKYTHRFAMVIQGSDDKNVIPDLTCSDQTPFWGKMHTVVVGGGPAGLTAALYLTDRGKRVLLLEREEQLGGAALGTMGDLSYGRGGAYITDVEKNLLAIYQHLGLGNFLKEQQIPEPIDSYWWNDKYYRGVWEDPSLIQLPTSFSVFRYLLEKQSEENQIPSQPMETHSATAKMDRISFADWVRQCPEFLEKRALLGDEKAKKLLIDLQQENLTNSDPMRPVLKMLELYGRSALGEHPENLSAAAFANFYISEVGPRYSSSLGSGFVSRAALRKLMRRPWFHFRTKSPVGKIIQKPRSVQVCFFDGNQTWRVESRYVVYAAPLRFAPQIIENFNTLAPEKSRIIEGLEYRHYQVMNVHLKGHPWHDSYGLWIRNDSTYSGHEVTDLIEGRWFDFEGNKLPRTDDKGVLTLYNPLPKEYLNVGLSEKVVMEVAERSATELEQLMNDLLLKRGQPPIQILAVEINRWPYSIHVVRPGHLSESAPILAESLERIFFASNNIGTPAVEEALYRGFTAAKEILSR